VKVTNRELRLVDLLAALSVATDLGMGQPPEKAIRSCLLATGLARGMGLPEHQVQDVYLTTLLQHLGCTATASEEARLGGDELVSRPADERADFGSVRETVALMLGSGRGTGLQRPRYLARAVSSSQQIGVILQAVCEVGAHLARRLGLGEAVQQALNQVFERWDGKGAPRGLAGDDINLAIRVAAVATQAVIFDREGGPATALRMVKQRAGGWFDPAVAGVFDRLGADLLREISAWDPWVAVVEAEPRPVQVIAPTKLDHVARVFADMVDLKSTYTLGHSSEVAELATRAACALGLSNAEVDNLRRAALFHDLGRTAVSSRIWDKQGPATRAEQEQIRLHPYHTERILARSATLEPLARIAGMHHERLDGSGYHRAATATAIPMAARMLAAADTYQAATQDRPHRAARPVDQAASMLAQEASAGRLDPECVRALMEVAGQPSATVRPSWPSGLTDREVEVLRLVARGLSNKQVATRLVISTRTAEHHVQHIYSKIGASSRAAASLFAMEHGLLHA
jgi:HD-GYP domain-containing protein (c-di-GMP phosphodiesterase class II)